MDEGKQHLETLISADHDGNVEGQFYLGVAYSKSIGVEQDDDQAVHWYRLAAEHGDADAQFNLGAAYYRGQGVEQDDEQTVYRVFTTRQGTSPINLVAGVNEHGTRLLQVKNDGSRLSAGRRQKTRIHRVRSELQKALDVEMVYVNVDTRVVWCTDHDYKANLMAAANDNQEADEV